MNLIDFYIVGRYLHKRYLTRPLSKVLFYFQFLIFNSVLPHTASIGKGTRFAYGGIGAVIHGNSVIGENCIIGQGVTIGGRSKILAVPSIGNNVYIGAGARVLGNVVVGNEVVIGANCVVITDIPSNCVVVGVPGRVIKSNIKSRDFF